MTTSKPPTDTRTDEYNAALGYHPTVPPLDIRLGITSPPPTKDPQQLLRWGILGCSKVAHDFAQALKFLHSKGLPHCTIAIGSRCTERALSFGLQHSIPNVHGSYEALCADTTVDIVYVATLHPHHKTHAEMALKNGKHVLIEKPITMNATDAKYLYDLGKELNLFVGEGMWTRFFPAVEWTRCHLVEKERKEEISVVDNGDIAIANNSIVPIGQVRVVQADFSIDGTDVGLYPTDSLFATELGGGSAWCVLPYIVAATMLPFENKVPERIAANGIVPNDEGVGDLAMGMTLTFSTGSSKNGSEAAEATNLPEDIAAIASGLCSYLAESSEITMYAAKGGRITVESPAHCPTSATIVRKSAGERGNGESSNSSHSNGNGNGNGNEIGNVTVHFPLPESTPEIEESGGIKLPNSMGFIYEAEAVRRLIAAKQISFPQWTPEESIGCIRIIEEMLRQVNKS